MSDVMAHGFNNPPSKGREGYRYCRAYQTPKGHFRYALWEMISGKATRVGTATSYQHAENFIYYRHD